MTLLVSARGRGVVRSCLWEGPTARHRPGLALHARRSKRPDHRARREGLVRRGPPGRPEKRIPEPVRGGEAARLGVSPATGHRGCLRGCRRFRSGLSHRRRSESGKRASSGPFSDRDEGAGTAYPRRHSTGPVWTVRPALGSSARMDERSPGARTLEKPAAEPGAVTGRAQAPSRPVLDRGTAVEAVMVMACHRHPTSQIEPSGWVTHSLDRCARPSAI